jgi:4-diphosphocytidyl-2-C-methyl-D-erythritol kinase
MARRRSSRPIRVRAFAKLNLTLRVLGTRADGFHELRTIFQSLALHDTLTLTPIRGEFTIECDDPGCPKDASNLVWAAAERLWRETGRRGTLSGVRVRIRKRIPMQAGLGGGSSDAAATLRALARWWRVDAGRVRDVAASLGADVPYFLEGGTSLGLDRGDVLFPLVDAPPFWLTIVVPPFGVSTKDAYRWWDSRGRVRGGAGRIRRISARLHTNDLEPVVTAHHPEIGRIVRALERAGASHAAMSGSGSAVFGLFDGRPPAERAAKALIRTFPKSAAVFVTRTLNRRQYRRLVGLG